MRGGKLEPCRVCGRPVLRIPWHDNLDGTAHQVCSTGAEGPAWARQQRGRLHQGRAADVGDWTAGLTDGGALVVHVSGRHAELTWARLRTIAVGNSLVPLVARDVWPVRGDKTALAPLLELVGDLGLADGIVSVVDVLDALGAVEGPDGEGSRVRISVPWSVPAEVIQLAGQLAGRGRVRES